ncbi:MAG: ABC transporter permease subunit [Acidobacteriota bacterium]|nr:MAG: ABC transporter permease subunit [Acidobacteriota bacterium]
MNLAHSRRARPLRIAFALLVCTVIGSCTSSARAAASEPIVVGSKNFAENRLLAELFARLIEARTRLSVERRLNLAGTQVCFEALRTGAIDLYPEYTGTGLVTLLGEAPRGGATETLNFVRREFLDRFDLWWLSPLGFENAYELAVPTELAEREGLRTISDLTRISGQLRAGLGYEFIERADGLAGLRETYGLAIRDVLALQQALKYQAAAAREIDCLDVYTTDGRMLVHELTVLEDDRDFFPPYQAAPLLRGETLRRHPELGAVLSLLADAIDEDTMRQANLRVQEQGEPIERVAQQMLERLGLVGEKEIEAVSTRELSLMAYMLARRGQLVRRGLEHLGLTALALALGILVAVPLGLYLERRRRVAESIIRAIGITQTIPSIALLAFMIPLLGVGAAPAVVALWIYSIFPMLRNTYTGLRDAFPAAVQAASALGMTDAQVLRRVRLPLAVPVILAGVRTSAVLTVGTATLAAFIGAGGLGVPIVAGLQLADTTRILSGALPAAALALLVDAALALIERALRPRGLV